MKHWNLTAPTEDLSIAWCNANAAATSFMEAISFATPMVESFLIRTVAESLPRQTDAELAGRCRTFIRDESNHSRAHAKFNAALHDYLGGAPPALAVLRTLLGAARTRLSLPSRLLLVAALEHFTAVLSMAYLKRQARWHFRSPFAKELFVRHAAEELSHCSVAFDLWAKDGTASRFARAFSVLAILAAGLVYTAAAVPWILYRKSGRRLAATLFAMAGVVTLLCREMKAGTTLCDLFCFTRPDYHPDRLIDEGLSGGID